MIFESQVFYSAFVTAAGHNYRNLYLWALSLLVKGDAVALSLSACTRITISKSYLKKTV